MDKFEVFLERVENKNNARETTLTYNDGSIVLSSRMWSERNISPECVYSGHAELRFILDRANTEKFFKAIGCDSASLENVLAVVVKDFVGDPREGYFYDNLTNKIEDIISRNANGIQKERFYQRAAEENELPDYSKLPNPSHKFEVFCLMNGVEYSVKENGSSDYYDG
jgi:hypothetical protein